MTTSNGLSGSIRPLRPPPLEASPSAARVRLGRLRLELVRHERLVADAPRVVAGLDHVGMSRRDLRRRAVVVADREAAGADDADMADLAALGACAGLDALGPLPPGL